MLTRWRYNRIPYKRTELNNKDIRTIAIIFLVALVMILGVLLWASRGMAQEKAKLYTPTEVQQLRLQVMQKDAQLLQAQLQQVQRQFQEKVSELMSTANKFKLENGWPPETTFSPDTLVFSAPPEKEKKP